MAATEPIRDKNQLKELADYFLRKGQLRNYTLVMMGTYTVLRISDLLRLKWSDVYDEEKQEFRTHITVIEKKTKKERTIALNPKVLSVLKQCYLHRRGEYIFSNNRKNPNSISRVQAWRIIHAAVVKLGIMGKIACHSLRKTWGYHAVKSGSVPLAVVVDIYNHSSYEITKRYLGITQDERDEAYLGLELF